MTPARLTPLLSDRLAALVPGAGWRRIAMIRRTAAAALALLALVLALAPQGGPSGVPVVVAARDLEVGAELVPDDLAVRTWPAGLVPDGAVGDLTDAQGQILAGPARAGEPLTDVRLTDVAAPDAGADGAAVPVRIADAAVGALLVPGSRVDVVTLGPEAEGVVVATDAIVLAVLPEDAGDRGRLVTVAMPRELATRVAAAVLVDQVAVTLRPPVRASDTHPGGPP